MGKITITNPNNTPHGALFIIQYFENIDKVQAWNTNLKLHRNLYKEVTDNSGTKLQKLHSKFPSIQETWWWVTPGLSKLDRTMDYVLFKDLRPTGSEPVEQLSGYRSKGGLGYYQSIRDASAKFLCCPLAKRHIRFEYRLFATIAGQLAGRNNTIQLLLRAGIPCALPRGGGTFFWPLPPRGLTGKNFVGWANFSLGPFG